MAEFSKKKITKTLQFLAAYIVAIFTFLEILQWVTKRFSISPHWLDIYVWIFVGLIPSVLIYFYHQDRINKNIVKLREKIIFPLNALLVIIVIFLLFGSRDLGSTTEEIIYPNPDGELEPHIVTKKDFRIGFHIFNFDFDKKIHATNWMPYTINRLLWIDLLQDSNLAPLPNHAFSFIEKIEKSRPFFDYYIDGEFTQQDSVYIITTYLRHAKKSGSVKDQKSFSGTDYLALIDMASSFIREALGVISRQNKDYIDLPIKEIMTPSLAALGAWSQGGQRNYEYYERAIRIDSTFAIGYLDLATIRFSNSHNKEESKYLANRAFELSAHLPNEMQGTILNQKYLSNGEWEKAEDLTKVLIKNYGRQRNFDRTLSTIYAHKRDFKTNLKFKEEIYEIEKHQRSAEEYYESLLLNKEYKKTLHLLNDLETKGSKKENMLIKKAWVYLLKGDVPQAQELLNEVKLLDPKPNSKYLLMGEAIDYLKTKNDKGQDHTDFVGIYRFDGTEQLATFFIKDDEIYSYLSNLFIDNYVKSEPNTYINPLGSSKRRIFLRDSMGKVYAFKSQNDPVNNPKLFWYYKVDDYISKADSLLKANNYQAALPAYKQAIVNNPKHYFLKDGLEHIEYITKTDSTSIQNQYQRVIGNYGSTKVTLEENRLFYDQERFAKYEILPISETEYITLSRYSAKYDFEFLDDDHFATFISIYNPETNCWEKDPEGKTYFLKDN